MNPQHPVPTLHQRRALAAYTSAQRGADAAREAQTELERLLAAKRAAEEARAARYQARREYAARCAERASFERRHGAHAPAPLTGRQLLLIGLAWCAVMGATLWLCTDAGMRFLVALWSAK